MSLRVTNVLESCLSKKKAGPPPVTPKGPRRLPRLWLGDRHLGRSPGPGPFRPRRCQCTATRGGGGGGGGVAQSRRSGQVQWRLGPQRERAARVAGVTAVHHRGTASRGSPRALGGPRFASSLERVRSEFSVKPLNQPFLTECVPAYSRLQSSCFLLRRKSTCSRLQLSHCSGTSESLGNGVPVGPHRTALHCQGIPSGLLSR